MARVSNVIYPCSDLMEDNIVSSYRMPAEWTEHERCWMAWPSREDFWDDIDRTRRGYAAVAHAIRWFEPVTMLVPNAMMATAKTCSGQILNSWKVRSVRRVLDEESDAAGRSFELLTLPEAPEDYVVGERFCLSYVNFYYANGAIIAPVYGIPTDDAVRERLQSYFPGREIALAPITGIAIGGGGIHCITQQQPQSRTPNKWGQSRITQINGVRVELPQINRGTVELP